MPATIASKVASPGLDIEVRHAVDRRAVPVVGSGVRRAGKARAQLRRRASQRPLEDPVADQMDALGGSALVVPAVAGELFPDRGIERDIEKIGAVPVRPEHLRRDEARAGEVPLVAENAVELERMSDRLVDLQDHLVRHQQHVHRSARAIGGPDELERLLGNARIAPSNAKRPRILVASLLADPTMAVERPGLRDPTRVRGHRHTREQEAKVLDDVAAVARDEPLRRVDDVGRPRPSPRSAGRGAPRATRASGARTSRGASGPGRALRVRRTRRAPRFAAASASR
jgi:hypothetical protein